MAHWPLATVVNRSTSTMRAANGHPSGVTLTASATPHTKGPYTEVIASTPADTRLLVMLGTINVAAGATDTAMLMDIAIGAAASETIILADLNVGAHQVGNTATFPFLILPFIVPDGSRISARIQAVVVSDTFGLAIDTYGGASLAGAPFAGVAIDTYGTNAATSRGTVVTTAAANTYGSWVEVVASTTAAYRAAFLRAGLNGDLVVNHSMAVELGVGASGSEQPLLLFPMTFSSSEAVERPLTDPAPFCHINPIPAGSRLAVRAKSSGTTKTADVSVYGLRG